MNQSGKTKGEQQRAPHSSSKPAKPLGQQILDIFDFVLRFFLGSRWSVVGLLFLIIGIVLFFTASPQNSSWAILVIVVGLAMAGIGYWLVGRHD